MGQLNKQWIDGILEVLGNVTTEEANKKVNTANLSLHSKLRGK
jgi:hypothetical protein